MFGYIKPNTPELKVKEHELYKATYCGLCKTMGKCTGCFSKFKLSYDFAFLALLRTVVDRTKVEVKMGRCIAHPIKKRPMVKVNDSLKFSAKSSVILTRLKLKDNVNDSHGFARLGAKIVGCVSIFLKKTDKNLKELEEKIKAHIAELSALEKQNSDSLDQTAQTFGALLGDCASHSYEGASKRLMYDIGFHLGKWIYVIDAVDDFESDIKKKSFNPIVNSYGTELTQGARETLYHAMMLELSAMSKSLELIDFKGYEEIYGIIKNVIYDGMVKESGRVLKFTPN